MKKTRFIMLGGFLGAGKTTALTRLARQYVAQGKRVGIVTNDQAADLVDTHLFRAEGFAVEEVAGACFCCSFDDLVDRLGRLAAHEQPDVLLAEPVGSCTDLVATVVRPLEKLHGRRYEVSPYVVLLKPDHGRKILSGERRGGFSPKAAYIFKKQLEEADAVAINKVDTLTAQEREQLVRLLRENCAETPVLAVSARTGEGFEELAAVLDQAAAQRRRTVEVDYDTYAEGEAQLGWLNSTVTLRSDRPFELDRVLMDLLTTVAEALDFQEAQTAHLKILVEADGRTAVANLVASGSAGELSRPSNHRATEARLIVNARVEMDPDLLREVFEEALRAVTKTQNITTQPGASRHFRPARPVPTHRYSGV